jgi:hypothetical protein
MEIAMNDAFGKKIQSAAVAGWWTLLIAAGFLTLQWIAYLLVLSARPALLLPLFGQDASWQTVQKVWFWALAIVKVCLWLSALLVLWLTLWARQLRKQVGSS